MKRLRLNLVLCLCVLYFGPILVLNRQLEVFSYWLQDRCDQDEGEILRRVDRIGAIFRL